jgi:O-antigen/teichoic acid export membrane protein
LVAGSLVVGQVLVGVTYIVAARDMGPVSLGLVATCFAIGTILATIFDYGLMPYMVREVAAGRITVLRARALVRTKRRFIPLLVTPTTVACLLIMPEPLDGAVMGMVGWLIWEAQTGGSLLRARDLFARAVTAQLAGRALGLAVTIVLMIPRPPEQALVIGLASSFALEALINHGCIGRTRTCPARPRVLLEAQRRSLSFGLVSLAAIGQQLDTPLVTAGGGAVASGMYAGAARLLGPLLFLSSSLALVGPSWLAGAQLDPDKLRREERRIRWLTFYLCICPILAAMAGPFVIPLLLGDQFAASGAVFSILAVGAMLSTLSQGLALVLQNRGAEKVVGRAISAGLILGLVVTYVAAVVGGPIWAALGFVVSQLYIITRLGVAVRARRSG